VWVALDVLVVILEYRTEELVLGVTDRFDDETVVAREVEKGARFSR